MSSRTLLAPDEHRSVGVSVTETVLTTVDGKLLFARKRTVYAVRQLSGYSGGVARHFLPSRLSEAWYFEASPRAHPDLRA